MGRIAKILLRVRDSLSDPNAKRWSNDRLLRLIDEAQVDIATKAKLLRTTANVAVTADKAIYDLPSDAIDVTRCVKAIPLTTGEQEKIKLLIKSHADMDEIDPFWETETGTEIEFIVFDKLSPNQIKVYPISTIDDDISTYLFPTDFGVTTDSTGDVVNPDFGVVTDITTTATFTKSFNSDFGVLTDMDSVVASLIIYYNKRPATIDDYSLIDTGQVLEVDEVFDKAIKHYVVGMCLRDDKDTQNRQMGSEELLLYTEEVKFAKGLSASDRMRDTRAPSSYITGFEK